MLFRIMFKGKCNIVVFQANNEFLFDVNLNLDIFISYHANNNDI